MVQDALDGKIDLIVTKSVSQFVRNTVDSFTTVRKLEVVPEEAETVRLIYRLFMQGQTSYAIAKYLTDKNIPTPKGKEIWWHRTVENILSNEKRRRPAAEVLHGGFQ